MYLSAVTTFMIKSKTIVCLAMHFSELDLNAHNLKQWHFAEIRAVDCVCACN